jgi:hypothetical protein
MVKSYFLAKIQLKVRNRIIKLKRTRVKIKEVFLKNYVICVTQSSSSLSISLFLSGN